MLLLGSNTAGILLRGPACCASTEGAHQRIFLAHCTGRPAAAAASSVVRRVAAHTAPVREPAPQPLALQAQQQPALPSKSQGLPWPQHGLSGKPHARLQGKADPSATSTGSSEPSGAHIGRSGKKGSDDIKRGDGKKRASTAATSSRVQPIATLGAPAPDGRPPGFQHAYVQTTYRPPEQQQRQPWQQPQQQQRQQQLQVTLTDGIRVQNRAPGDSKAASALPVAKSAHGSVTAPAWHQAQVAAAWQQGDAPGAFPQPPSAASAPSVAGGRQKWLRKGAAGQEGKASHPTAAASTMGTASALAVPPPAMRRQQTLSTTAAAAAVATKATTAAVQPAAPAVAGALPAAPQVKRAVRGAAVPAPPPVAAASGHLEASSGSAASPEVTRTVFHTLPSPPAAVAPAAAPSSPPPPATAAAGAFRDAVLAELGDLLLDKGIELESLQWGNQRLLCPECGGGSQGEASLSVSLLEGEGVAVWNCFRATCGWTGRVRVMVMGPPREEGRNAAVAPVAKPCKAPTKPDTRRFQPLTPEQLAWFAARGIGAAALARNGVCRERRYSRGRRDWVDMLAFPFRLGGEVVNVKYRELPKSFCQTRGGQQVFYGLDDVPDAKMVVIVEGEMDKLALEVAGFAAVLSVPSGAVARVRSTSSSERREARETKFAFVRHALPLLEGVEHFVLATDSDAPGQALAEELRRRLGPQRCSLLWWPGQQGSAASRQDTAANEALVKDANDMLMRHGTAGLRQYVLDHLQRG